MKPTGLLCLNFPSMPRALLQHQLAKANPKKASIGKGSDGHWATGALKEYPPAMSRALATQFWAAISAHPITTDVAPDAAFLAVCAEMSVTTYTEHYGNDRHRDEQNSGLEPRRKSHKAEGKKYIHIHIHVYIISQIREGNELTKSDKNTNQLNLQAQLQRLSGSVLCLT